MRWVATVGQYAIGALGFLVAAGFIGLVVVGGMFYRTTCPSKSRWSFNPLPFVYTVHVHETACSTDTATGYYIGKVPVVGKPVRAVVKSFTGQSENTPSG